MTKPNEYVTDLFHKIRDEIAWIKHKLFTDKPKLETADHPRRYTVDAVHTNTESNHENDNSIRAILNLPPAIRVDAQTQERRQKWFKDRAVWLQVGTILVGIIVAIIYGLQLDAMLKANEISREAIYSQNRPWLGISGTAFPRSPMVLYPHGQLPATEEQVPYNVNILGFTSNNSRMIGYSGAFNLKNYGKGPAIHAAYSVGFALDEKRAKEASDGACEAAEKVIGGKDSTKSKGGITSFPDSEQAESFTAGGVWLGDAMPDHVLLLGCIKYDDTSGRRHTTRFCEYGMQGVSRASISCDFETYVD